MAWEDNPPGKTSEAAEAGAVRPGESLVRLPRTPYLLVSALWCVAALAVKPFFPYVDFGAFYSTAIEKILSGTPLDLYAFVAHPPNSTLAIPLSQPPVWFYYLSPWYALGRALGFDDFHRHTGISYAQAWMLLASLPLDVLLCRTVLSLAQEKERIGEPRRLYLFLCLLLSPLLWVSSVRFGHNESVMALLVLLAVAAGERGRPAVSGVLWGMALGVKTTAVIPALAYFGWGLGQGRRRATGVAALAAVPVFLGPLLPYLILRREQVWYALIGFEGIRPVGGYVLWKLLPDSASAASHANTLILIMSAGLGLVMARRPGKTFLASGGAWGLVLGQAFLLLFGKALYVWYSLAASVFLYLAVAYRGRTKQTIPYVPLLATLLLWMIQGGDWVGESVNPSIRTWSAAWVVLLLGIAAVAVKGLIEKDARSQLAVTSTA